jgi:hypothetical protein
MPRKYTRKTGDAARALTLRNRRRLWEFRKRHAARLGQDSLSIPQLKLSMNAPFTWETLQRAIAGKTIRADNCQFIEKFLDKHMPLAAGRLPAVGLDRKSVSAGERDEELDGLHEFAGRGSDAQDAVAEVIRRGSR